MTLDPALGSQAVLRFLPGWQQFRDGLVERGGRLSIAFDPERVTGCRRTWRGAEVWDIEAVVKFHPRGDLVRGSVMEPIRTDGVVTALSPKPLQMAVPSDAMQVEIWFHNFAEIGGRCDAWDSDFGKNYWFDVDGPWPIEPADPVRYRQGAIADSGVVNVLGQTAVKRNVFPTPANGPPFGKNLKTSLDVQAWVRNVAFTKAVWIDVHVFDRGGTRIEAATFGLSWQASDGGFGDLFGFNGQVYQGLTATPGSVSPKPNAWLIQYRLYYAVEDRLYTDAVLHQLEVVDDAVA